MSRIGKIEKEIEEIKFEFKDVGSNLNWIKKNWDKIKKKLDKNKDGIIQVKELANPWFIKIVLVNLLAIGTQIFLFSFIDYLVNGIWDWNTILIGLSTIVGPFMVGMITKFIVDDYDRRLKKLTKDKFDLRKSVDKKEIELIEEKSKSKISLAQKDVQYIEEISQLKIALDVKNEEIIKLRKGTD